MSWKAAQWAERQTTGSPYFKGVLLVLANAACLKAVKDGTGQAYQCHLSHETIRQRAECSPDTSQEALKQLERLGLAIRKLRYARGRRTANAIFLNVDDEPVAEFAARVGMPAGREPERAKPPAAAKGGNRLGRFQRTTKPLPAGVHYIEPGVEPGVKRALQEEDGSGGWEPVGIADEYPPLRLVTDRMEDAA